MEIVIDGRRGFGAKESGFTLGAVLDRVRGAIGSRTVVQLVLDGEDLTRERQQELLTRNASAFSLLEVKTVDGVAIGRETLTGIEAHLGNLERKHLEASQFFEACEYGRATERLSECAGGWDTLSRAARDVAGMAGLELRNLDAGGIRGDELVRRLNSALMRFRGAMEFRDVLRLSEIADQDLRPGLVSWRALVDNLRKANEGR